MYCDKCGEKIRDTNKPCPTCGMYLNSINNIDNVNKDSNSKIIIIVIIIVGVIFAGLSIFGSSFMASEEIDIVGNNYEISYKGSNWKESDLSNNEYYVIQNTNDLNAYLQFPVKAVELNMNIDSVDERESLYQSYSYLLKNDTDYKYHNIMSGFEKLDGTDNYYLTVDFYKYADSSLKGKVYIVVSSSGKAINILLVKGSKSILDIEEDVYEILREVEI